MEIVRIERQNGQRFVIHRREKDAAAIISIEDLRLFERLFEEEEDRIDIERARAALAEPGESIPYEEVRRQLGLSDEPKKRRTATKARAKTL